MYWITAYFYIFDIIYIKDKISVTLLNVDANYVNLIFSIYFLAIFNHLNSINYLFLKLYNSMEHLASTFLSKSLYIHNDIKKVIHPFWIDIFELMWNLILPMMTATTKRNWQLQLIQSVSTCHSHNAPSLPRCARALGACCSRGRRRVRAIDRRASSPNTPAA